MKKIFLSNFIILILLFSLNKTNKNLICNYNQTLALTSIFLQHKLTPQNVKDTEKYLSEKGLSLNERMNFFEHILNLNEDMLQILIDAGVLSDTFFSVKNLEKRLKELEEQIQYKNFEIKKMTCLYRISDMLNQPNSLDELLSMIVSLIPTAYEPENHINVRITIGDEFFESPNLTSEENLYARDIYIKGIFIGKIEFFYQSDNPDILFFDELISIITDIIEFKQIEEREQELLANILPKKTVELLMQGKSAAETVEYFDQATVLFSDIVGFTDFSRRLNDPQKLL